MERFLIWLGVVDTQNQAAVLQGLTNVIGVALTAAITAWIAIRTWNENARLERERRADETRADQKLREDLRRESEGDLHRALRAEIFNVWQAQYVYGPLDERLNLARSRFQAASAKGEDFTPFASSRIGTVLENVLIQQLTLLDDTEIQAVVGFYRQIRVIEGFSADLRTAEYRALSLERKETMLLDFLRMEDRLTLLAEDCLNLLEPKLKIPAAQRFQTRRKVIDEKRSQ